METIRFIPHNMSEIITARSELVFESDEGNNRDKTMPPMRAT